MRTPRAGCVAVAVAVLLAGCAAPMAPIVTAPRFPAYPVPEIPPGMRIGPTEQAQHERAWQWLQSGDPARAITEFSHVLDRAPGFYPAEAGLGFAYLADRRYRAAAERFRRAAQADAKYLPAWVGQAETQIALGDDAQAIAAMKQILALDPSLTDIQSRLDLVRFRQLQGLIEDGRHARLAGRLDEARRLLEDALARSPASGLIMLELARVEIEAKNLDTAEQRARQAIEAQPGDAEAHAALGAVLTAAGRTVEAAAAFSRAAEIDPRPEWRARSDTLREVADLAALPPEFGTIENAETLTRAQVAAFIGVRLKALLGAAPSRGAVVATDIRSHWAAPWILPVTQTGVMGVFANHTFQPSATVRRSDLADVAVELVSLAGSRRPADLARWQAARPRFEDVSTAHLSYRSAALAVAAGAMRTHDGSRFDPTGPATGADLAGLVARVEELAR
jgi:tetratricopeptide (TPR) repeat protein